MDRPLRYRTYTYDMVTIYFAISSPTCRPLAQPVMAPPCRDTYQQRPKRPQVYMGYTFFSLALCSFVSFLSVSVEAKATSPDVPISVPTAARIRRRGRRLGVHAGPGHSHPNEQQQQQKEEESSSGTFSVDDDFGEFHNSAATHDDNNNNPSVFSLARYVDPDSILYDTIEGFFFAAIFTVVVVMLYKCCCSCCEWCGMCPDTGRRRRKRRGVDEHDYAAISTDLYRDHHDKGGGLGGIGGYRNEYGDCDGSSSGVDSETSMEYGEMDDDEMTDRFDGRHIGDAAKRYFDREERIGRKKERKQRAAAGRSGARKGNGSGNGASRANRGGGGAKIKRGIYKEESTGLISGIDGEEPAPLDLEMIERKIVESMKDDDPEFARPPKR